MFTEILDYYNIDIAQDLNNGEVMVLCPFHEDINTPNCRIDLERDIWNCWGCSQLGKDVAGGHASQFVQRMEKFNSVKLAQIFIDKAILGEFNLEALESKFSRLGVKSTFNDSREIVLLYNAIYAKMQEQIIDLYKNFHLLKDYYFLKSVAVGFPDIYFEVCDTEMERKIQVVDNTVVEWEETLSFYKSENDMLLFYSEFSKEIQCLRRFVR